jgi:hypothetical protein
MDEILWKREQALYNARPEYPRPLMKKLLNNLLPVKAHGYTAVNIQRITR